MSCQRCVASMLFFSVALQLDMKEPIGVRVGKVSMVASEWTDLNRFNQYKQVSLGCNVRGLGIEATTSPSDNAYALLLSLFRQLLAPVSVGQISLYPIPDHP